MSSSEGSRFTEYTPTDHQALLWIATCMSLTYAGFILAVRMVVKYKVLGLDDAFLAVAYILGIAQWAITFIALNDGVGKLLPGIESSDAPNKLVFTSRILTLLVVGFTKCSVILFLRQLYAGTSSKGRTICSGLLVGTCCWMVASVLAVAIDCHPSGALLLESGSQCPGDLIRWKLVTGLDVCLELTLIILPAYLFYSIQISRRRKLTVFGSFFPRIAVPGMFIAYLEAYIHFRHYGGTSLDVVPSLVWQQVLCGYCLVTATTPCLKGFLGRFRTEITAINENTLYSRTHNQNSRSRPAPWSHALESLDRDGVRKRPPQHESNTFACRPAGTQSAVAYAETQGDNGDESVKSFGSEQMIIHRKVEYNVTSS